MATVPANSVALEQGPESFFIQSAANGCVGELADRWDVACPTSPDAQTYISSVRAFPGGVSIALTPAGIELGLSCDGAEWLVSLASDAYAGLPASVREYDNLYWANPYITVEVHAHAIIAATGISELVSHGNPVDIVFADYWTPGSQGLMWTELNNPNHVFSPGTCASIFS
jgi:hypothetical protein